MQTRFTLTLLCSLALAGACDNDSMTGADGSAGMDAGTPPGADASGGEECVPEDPIVDPALLPECDLCADARCVPAGLVPEDQRDRLADCGDGGKCVPDLYVETNGNFTLTTCRSVGGSEGRCVSVCLPDVAAQADLLPAEGCGASELCVPCYDPTTGLDTGACGQGCDPGPTEPPSTFERCCGDIGSCVPRSAVPPEQADRLGPDTCSGPDALCAPADLVDPTFIAPTCNSVAGAEGRCLPACLPDVARQADFLPQDSCAATHRCVPCFDPTNGEDTGSCRLNGDAPAEPPVTFDRCCGGIGACVPGDLVPADQRSQLGRDTCGEAGLLCAPDELIDGSTPSSCRSVADVEGRCLPACLPDVAARGASLPVSTCATTHRCVPCFDPTTGEETGSCSVNGDMPVEPPVVFEGCCGGIGICVPTTEVPPDQRSQLGADTCSDSSLLCAPSDFIDPAFTPPVCRSVGGSEGRCLPGCLPAVAAQASMLSRSSCAAAHLCAPCYDPTTGMETGSCGLNGDAPTEPPFVFAGCCAFRGRDRGTCIPSSLVPAGDRDGLPDDSCSSGNLCVPDPIVADPTYRFPGCTTTGLFGGGRPGACVPDCLLGFFEGLFVSRGACAAGEKCAPCTNPLTGAPSGACR